MSTLPSAKVILDSVSPSGSRLTTIEAVFHRFILAEVNTHRTHSRNSASSRAIPVKKQLEKVMTDPALPVSWPEEKPGMQGGEQLPSSAQLQAQLIWLEARDNAVASVKALTNADRTPGNELLHPLHKSLANRLLEPFMWHTAILSSTEAGWSNLFAQRCHPAAQPEFRAVAEAMRVVYENSTPTPIGIGEWHTPYLTPEEQMLAAKWRLESGWRAVSAARCARVSYLTHDGKRDLEEDMKLFNKLTSETPPHASPLEHVATPSLTNNSLGNFDGWHQLRHLVEENKR